MQELGQDTSTPSFRFQDEIDADRAHERARTAQRRATTTTQQPVPQPAMPSKEAQEKFDPYSNDSAKVRAKKLERPPWGNKGPTLVDKVKAVGADVKQRVVDSIAAGYQKHKKSANTAILAGAVGLGALIGANYGSINNTATGWFNSTPAAQVVDDDTKEDTNGGTVTVEDVPSTPVSADGQLPAETLMPADNSDSAGAVKGEDPVVDSEVQNTQEFLAHLNEIFGTEANSEFGPLRDDYVIQGDQTIPPFLTAADEPEQGTLEEKAATNVDDIHPGWLTGGPYGKTAAVIAHLQQKADEATTPVDVPIDLTQITGGPYGKTAAAIAYLKQLQAEQATPDEPEPRYVTLPFNGMRFLVPTEEPQVKEPAVQYVRSPFTGAPIVVPNTSEADAPQAAEDEKEKEQPIVNEEYITQVPSNAPGMGYHRDLEEGNTTAAQPTDLEPIVDVTEIQDEPKGLEAITQDTTTSSTNLYEDVAQQLSNKESAEGFIGYLFSHFANTQVFDTELQPTGKDGHYASSIARSYTIEHYGSDEKLVDYLNANVGVAQHEIPGALETLVAKIVDRKLGDDLPEDQRNAAIEAMVYAARQAEQTAGFELDFYATKALELTSKVPTVAYQDLAQQDSKNPDNSVAHRIYSSVTGTRQQMQTFNAMNAEEPNNQTYQVGDEQ